MSCKLCFFSFGGCIVAESEPTPSVRTQDRRPTETYRPKSSVANPRGFGRPIRSTAIKQERDRESVDKEAVINPILSGVPNSE